VLGLAYVAVYGAIASKPSLEAMVPPDAVLVWRYRDLAAYDERNQGDPGPQGTVNAPARVALGAALNLGPRLNESASAELPGIDRRRPLLEILLDPGTRPDPRYVVLPVERHGPLGASRPRPRRHASYLAIRRLGSVSWDLGAVRTPASGGLVPDAPGAVERHGRLAEVRRLPPPATASLEPQASILAGLAQASTPPALDAPGRPRSEPGGRVLRDAWCVTVTADRVRAGGAERRLTSKALAAAFAAADAPWRVETKIPGEASHVIQGAAPRRVTALALWYAGLRWPHAVAGRRRRCSSTAPAPRARSMDDFAFPRDSTRRPRRRARRGIRPAAPPPPARPRCRRHRAASRLQAGRPSAVPAASNVVA
jgi:hypothetical protein